MDVGLMCFRQISLLLGAVAAAAAVAVAAAQVWEFDAKGLQAVHTQQQETLHRRATCVGCVVIGASIKLHKVFPRISHRQFHATRTA
jgi:L-cystine uptake protein TcyP (sodium:dicarboxylate symporter family)